ncbi:hypothetical protein CROQUDRAFT_412297 [Cronartium quercuum f. sp. fusiforme G11]|uniref:Uncharacterized protein n=1 Tax=Cronartium quercuum f. sp. fusiforme G11 TaxID=708437 RepID=A0A9P6NLY5_9BASI|nr:hypothetical protein CROQUDRAFT_412297 [Cronartium quercuum f. sp. fusiforme G11]
MSYQVKRILQARLGCTVLASSKYYYNHTQVEVATTAPLKLNRESVSNRQNVHSPLPLFGCDGSVWVKGFGGGGERGRGVEERERKKKILNSSHPKFPMALFKSRIYLISSFRWFGLKSDSPHRGDKPCHHHHQSGLHSFQRFTFHPTTCHAHHIHSSQPTSSTQI